MHGPMNVKSDSFSR